MLKRHLFRTIIIIAVVAWAIYALLPNWWLNNHKKSKAKLLTELSQLSDIPVNELTNAVAVDELNALLGRRLPSAQGEKYDQALKIAEKIHNLEDKISSNEGRSIKRGLDLQGGTYLVYEVDLPQLMRDLGENKNLRFDSLVEKTAREALTNEDVDFFDALKKNFSDRNVKLSLHFGRKGQSDDDIIGDLKKEADDAVDRTLEVLRNRVDQFGVSEPNIQKQGGRRIIIELAGIQDIERAKKIIGTTALLEFKLLKDADLADRVRIKIDRVLKTIRKTDASVLAQVTDDTASSEKVDTTGIDSTAKIARDKEVTLSELFGETQVDSAQQEDTSIVVDEQTFTDQPFTSLLRAAPNQSQEMIVPAQNKVAVDRILQLPEVQKVLQEAESMYLWSDKPRVAGEEKFYELFLVKSEPELVGSAISDADVQIGGGTTSLTAGQPEVHMEMNSEGAKTFARVTGLNVGKRLAIVLDNKVSSAPSIRDKIPFGSARIDGIESMDEAKDLALVLRAGALPAPVEVIEERTVGPSLGQDSISKGTYSAFLGLILVVAFMVIYYNAAGIVADIALFLNIIVIMAFLGQFHATLTMPGVAGIILTIGMAVDANVLIFERIREELRAGKDPGAALKLGYERAFKTILDANVTTLITALALYQFGTGPVRGFAVTLSIGILASMFTAIVVTRAIFDFFLEKYSLKKLSI